MFHPHLGLPEWNAFHKNVFFFQFYCASCLALKACLEISLCLFTQNRGTKPKHKIKKHTAEIAAWMYVRMFKAWRKGLFSLVENIYASSKLNINTVWMLKEYGEVYPASSYLYHFQAFKMFSKMWSVEMLTNMYNIWNVSCICLCMMTPVGSIDCYSCCLLNPLHIHDY